ncbi:LCP family protein [Microaerobacter geothermalis]|uniref:LCP family protein n=1 Tax=Microaerobacter geothermalis TaxID=674972 RepID=UPI001F21E171|nr:LCP family protein [Microaerobacter geothermalis]MCF6093010.1 LCP family protein [Microaerobacter geothermalis]
MNTYNSDKRLRRKKRRFTNLKWISMFLILLLIGAGGIIWWQVERFIGKITTEEAAVVIDQPIEKEYTSEESISLLIIGKDTRPETGSLNTDVIMVAVLNPKNKQVTLVSLPRDTKVKVPGYKGYSKINGVYAKGELERREAEKAGKPVEQTGITLLKKTLERMLGIPIQHYVTVDFQGFMAVIDKLGGVKINVDKSMKYTDPTDGTRIDLEPGLQTLNGEQALGYVRHRLDNRGPNFYSSDFDRNRRQKEVVKAAVDKMKSFSGFASFFGVMDVAGDHIRTDLSKSQIKGIIMDFRSLDSSQIQSLETGGHWDSASAFTILSKEKLDNVRIILQREMNIDPTKVDELDDSATIVEPRKPAPPQPSHQEQTEGNTGSTSAQTENGQENQQEGNIQGNSNEAKIQDGENPGEGDSGGENPNGAGPSPDGTVNQPEDPTQLNSTHPDGNQSGTSQPGENTQTSSEQQGTGQQDAGQIITPPETDTGVPDPTNPTGPIPDPPVQ